MTTPVEPEPRELDLSEVADYPRGVEPPPSGGHQVQQLLPTGYESYVRIFHPFRRRSAPDKSPDGRSMTWRTMATELDVPFEASVHWQLILEYQSSRFAEEYINLEGDPDPALLSVLQAALAPTTGDESVYFYYGLATQMGLRPPRSMAWLGRLQQLQDIQRRVNEAAGWTIPGPERIWPDHRKWVVVSDYDLPSTYVASDRATGDRILASADIDVLPVDSSTLLSSRAYRLSERARAAITAAMQRQEERFHGSTGRRLD